jgi:aminobenzoyl-glutamate utilization protein B
MQAISAGWIDEQVRHFSDFHLQIWNYAEPAWREYKSAKAAFYQHRDLGHPVRLLLERGLHL